MLASVASSQTGSAVAATLFPLVGPVGVVALRQLTSAAALTVIGRGVALPGRTRAQRAVPIAMGVVLAVMNTSFYAAVARLPLGVVITVELVGPISLSLWHSHQRRDVVLAVAALAGVALLTGGFRGGGSLVGLGFTLVAASTWALYIVLNRELSRQAADGGLALATFVAAVLVTPFAVAGAVHARWNGWTPRVVLIGVAVGLLASALPYTLDRLALRRMGAGTYSVLMSLHPVAGAVAGLLLLGQVLSPVQLTGMAVVVAVSVAVVRASTGQTTSPPDGPPGETPREIGGSMQA